MVEDFNEFSAIVTNPVERLHLKQFVKTCSTSVNPSEHTAAASTKNIQDDFGKKTCSSKRLYIKSYSSNLIYTLPHTLKLMSWCTCYTCVIYHCMQYTYNSLIYRTLLHNLHLEHLGLWCLCIFLHHSASLFTR